MSVFAPDSYVWLGVVLGLTLRGMLVTARGAISIILNDAAKRFVDRRAHARAVRDLRTEAEQEESR